MTLKDDGLPYLEVYAYKPRPKKGTDSILESISEEFSSAVKRAFTSYYVYPFELYPKLSFTKEILLSEEPYTLQVDFAELPPENFSYLKVYDSQGEEVRINALEEKIRVGRDRVNMRSRTDDGTKHSGYGLASFLDPYSNNEYILEIDYLIECIPVVVRTVKDDRGVATGLEVEDERIDMFITAKIGNRTYLYGEQKLDRKKTVPISVVDWNLDGRFSDEDMVRIEYKKKAMFFPINKKFKVGKGKKATRYIIELEETGDDQYLLSIEEA